MVAPLNEPEQDFDPRNEFLPSVAERCADWFPSFGRRFVAVSEAEITTANRPTLPFGLVALNRTDTTPAQSNSRVTGSNITIADDFIIELWYPVERFIMDGDDKGKASSEKPFWAYYPYERVRDYLLSKMYRESQLPGRENWGISFVSMDIAPDPQAVVLTFRFTRSYNWCPLPDEDDDPEPVVLSFSACPSQCEE